MSETQINAIAHPVVLLRLLQDADAADIASPIEGNANPPKWICAEEGKAIVEDDWGTLVNLRYFSNDLLADYMDFKEQDVPFACSTLP